MGMKSVGRLWFALSEMALMGVGTQATGLLKNLGSNAWAPNCGSSSLDLQLEDRCLQKGEFQAADGSGPLTLPRRRLMASRHLPLPGGGGGGVRVNCAKPARSTVPGNLRFVGPPRRSTMGDPKGVQHSTSKY